MRITKNFTLEEFTKSETAKKFKIKNTPEDFEIENIINLVKNLMQPLRDHYNKPIIITSGFRCEELNRKIFGAFNSQHILGEACDFYVKGVDNKEVCNYIKDNMLFDQLILEKSWIHVSYAQENREEYMIL